jgi:tRNA-specific 2-thiouridylase
MPDQGEEVLVAMSGGVDSSVAASLLRDAGCDVTGVFLRLGAPAGAGCAAERHAADARRAAETLGIPLVVLDASSDLEPIIEHFAAEYARGRTPNPCVHCNARVKFAALARQADALGARRVATGHHARIVTTADGPAVARARAAGKDQSYALFAVARDLLPRIVLPIGEVDDKNRIREAARELGLAVHDKPDSQEVCFVPNDGYAALLRARAPEALRPGEIVNAAGEVVGHHDGYGRYTIGQRRGLRVAAGTAMYVTHIDAAAARVTIGLRDELLGRRLSAGGANWHAPVPDAFDATVQIRSQHAGAPARVRITGRETFEVDFARPVAAITPGQAAVVYDGDRLLGGGWID